MSHLDETLTQLDEVLVRLGKQMDRSRDTTELVKITKQYVIVQEAKRLHGFIDSLREGAPNDDYSYSMGYHTALDDMERVLDSETGGSVK
jgi:hypothetical protein